METESKEGISSELAEARVNMLAELPDKDVFEKIQGAGDVRSALEQIDNTLRPELSMEEIQARRKAAVIIRSLIEKIIEAQRSGRGNTEVIYDTRYPDLKFDQQTRGFVRTAFGGDLAKAEQIKERTEAVPAQYEAPTFIPGLTWRINAFESLEKPTDPGIPYEAFRYEPEK